MYWHQIIIFLLEQAGALHRFPPHKKLTQQNHHFITPYSVNVCELNLHIKKNLESDSCILFNCIAVLIISL